MDLVHDRHGAGPPLLLVHGIGSRRGVWDPVVERLASEREVVAMDLPGFGASPRLPAGTPSTIDTLADAVEAFAAGQGLERPHVAGNSLGGAIALVMARRGTAGSAVALSPAGFWTDGEIRLATASLRTSRAVARALRPAAPRLLRYAPVRAAFFGQMFARPARLSPEAALADVDAFVGAPAFDETLDSTRRWSFEGGRGIEVPVTVAWGTKDRLLLPRQAGRARERIPQGRHVRLPGCGHVPMVDDPQAVASVILEGTRERAATAGSAAAKR